MTEIYLKENDVHNDKNQVEATRSILSKLTEIQIIIDVKTRELEQFRNLRLNNVTLNEIRILEGKLIKHFSRQLELKHQVNESNFSSDLNLYPSLSKFLTVAGVSNVLSEALLERNDSVEDLLELSDSQLSSFVLKANGEIEDSKKLASTLDLLRKGQDSQLKPGIVHEVVTTHNLEPFENNVGEVENGSTKSSVSHSRNTSECSNLFISNESDRRTSSTSISPSLKNEVPDDILPPSRQLSSTSNSSGTPNTMRKLSNASDDSAFVSRDHKLSLTFLTPTVTNTSTTQTPVVTPGTPHRSPNLVINSGANDFLSVNKNHSRSQAASPGARSTHHGLSSTLPHSFSKHGLAKQKKQKRRPGNIVIDDSNVPNYITFQNPRSGNRRGSATVMGEGAFYHTSPLSPRTPMTPVTPCRLELVARDREISSNLQSGPHTPKTPKNFNPLKKIWKMGKKITRHKSTELLDDDLRAQAHRRSSDSRRVDVTQQLNVAVPSLYERRDSFPLPRRASAAEVNSTIASDLRESAIQDDDRTSQRVSSDDETSENNQVTAAEVENKSENALSNLFRQPSMINSEEWDIPYDELKFVEKIGSGRVGTVHRGYWHGDVAIRVIDVCHNDKEKLQAFKQKVMIYKKTRHENLELFMGSCMKPPHLAIVTDFCRGEPLYNYIRSAKGQSIGVNFSKIIAQHIAQGMGYLHSKGIIHKDLKSKNIFIDGKRVYITDFGLVGLHAVQFNATRAKSNELAIPDGWLCYLAPEVLCALRCPVTEEDDVISTLPYTSQSDVYAFGTVWYELLAGSWPFKDYPAESVIYQAGSGKKQNLSQLQGGKDVKDLLMQCWSFSPSNRPDFSNNGIMGILKNLQTQILRTLSTQPRRSAANRGAPHERLFEAIPLSHTPISTVLELTE